MIQASIDIGTNTMLLLVAETEEIPSNQSGQKRKILKTIDSRIEYPRLGYGVNANRKFSLEAMNRAEDVFKKYKEICNQYKVEKIFAVATSASRDSINAKEFFDKIKKLTQIEVSIIPGEQEAKLSFLGGLLPMNDPQNTAILDIGGGSTEFVVFDKINNKISGQSIDMGCVRGTEMFLRGDPYEKQSLEILEKYLKEMWKQIHSDLSKELRNKEWVAIAGTPTTLAAHALHLPVFTSEKVDGYRLSRCHVADLYESLATQTETERKANPVIGQGRSDLIVTGAAILLTAMETFEKEDVIVSSRGLRHGILLGF